jgi:hypothetical protein
LCPPQRRAEREKTPNSTQNPKKPAHWVGLTSTRIQTGVTLNSDGLAQY